MENLTLAQAQKFIDNIVERSLNNFNAKHPDNIITHKDSYYAGYINAQLACLLAGHSTIESFINDNIDCLPMDKE
jgi:hypothetical protein